VPGAVGDGRRRYPGIEPEGHRRVAQVIRSGGERRRHLVWGQRERTGGFPYLCVCGRVDDAAAKLAEAATIRPPLT
jgi:hypothetical protein